MCSTGCSHVFCKECLDRWLDKGKKTCPLCRCTIQYFKNNDVKCIPIGYKSGISDKQKSNRKYKWAFTGTPHKSSRHELLFQYSDIKPFFCHRTEKFD